MAKARNLREAAELYGGGSEFWFKLVDDGDTAVVRFLHENVDEPDDEAYYVVHEVHLDGRKRVVKCWEDDDCPGCKEGLSQKVKLYLQLVTKQRPNEVKVWDRGKEFVPKILGQQDRNGPLCNRPYEIERHGRKGDSNTSYELYALERDDRDLKELPKRQRLVGNPFREDGPFFILDLEEADYLDAIDGRLRLPQNNNNSRDNRGRDSGRRDGGRSSRSDDRGGRGGYNRDPRDYDDRGRDRDRGSRDYSRDRDGGDRRRGEERDERDRDRDSDRSRDRGRDDRDRDRDSDRSRDRDSYDDREPERRDRRGADDSF